MAAVALASSAAALLALLLLVGPGLRREARDGVRNVLQAEARLMGRVLEGPLARGASSQELDALVDASAGELRARVTLIDPQGHVVADSSLSGQALAQAENHASRPEVKEALTSGVGAATRRSTTVNEELLYVAVPIRDAGRVTGVVRVALPLTGVESRVADLRRSVLLALLFAFLITAGLSALLARPLAGPLEEIMTAARQFAAGNLGARIRVHRSDELGELARILNQSAAELQTRLTENARDRARSEAILTAMEDGVLGVDHKGVVLLANNALRKNLGLLEPVGRHYLEVIRQKEVGEVVERVLKTGLRSAVEVELRQLRRVFQITAVPFPGNEGTPPGAVLTFHDATERQRLERVRRDFVANASHELRTPLTSIRGFVEALEDGAVDEPKTAERFLGKIRTHADRMAALVDDLLELSRLESGERPPRYEEVLPSEVVEDVLASFARLASGRDIQLVRGDDSAPAVVTDADRIRRIIENLVENAVKYTGNGGRVEVSSRKGPDESAAFEVRDNGPGIGAEHLSRIFERFYRVDKARSREMGGTGLGLAIVRHLAEGMGAGVTVESEIGKGTAFRVSVPAGREHLTAQE
jgi:two-component system phosphate regulon sensor histidine kinase PhoR